MMILVAIYLVVIPVVESPKLGFLFAGLTMVVGLVLYYPLVYRQFELKIISKTRPDSLPIYFFFLRQNQSMVDGIFLPTKSTSDHLMVEIDIFFKVVIFILEVSNNL